MMKGSNKNCGCPEETEHFGIFLCHSKKDKELADIFDSVAPRVGKGVRIFRKEFEDIGSPPDHDIIRDICTSKAVFVLIGPGLVGLIKENESKDWLHTVNWMSFEIGIATAFKRDIWLVTTDPMFNFPVLNFNVLLPVMLKGSSIYLKERVSDIIKMYEEYSGINVQDLKNSDPNIVYYCPNEKCRKGFFLGSEKPFQLSNRDRVRCPSCGQEMVYFNGKFIRRIIIRRAETNILPPVRKEQTNVTNFEVDE